MFSEDEMIKLKQLLSEKESDKNENVNLQNSLNKLYDLPTQKILRLNKNEESAKLKLRSVYLIPEISDTLDNTGKKFGLKKQNIINLALLELFEKYNLK